MSASRPPGIRRRVLFGVPALIAAAVTLIPRPAHASTAAPECVADLIRNP